jgi:hypothetical protein
MGVVRIDRQGTNVAFGRKGAPDPVPGSAAIGTEREATTNATHKNSVVLFHFNNLLSMKIYTKIYAR